ncbi:MAG: LuxR C-terminal-related transcriptional regulator [Nocardioides sp.]|uniref:LuxR C-terminal-related transcriptional regulator n=1 Tax=Nocardioides sp. TaxID=35761 RepID=UPI003F07E4A6
MDQVTPPSAETTQLLEQCVARAQRAAGMDIAFAGLVHPAQSHLSITSLRGTRTNSLANLRVRAGEGLGGKALALRRPAAVSDYLNARGITRSYDHAVAPESLRAIISLPLAAPGRTPVAVLYLADRSGHGVGERTADALRTVVVEAATDLHVAVETQRRLEAVRADLARAATVDLPDMRSDLQALLEATTDPDTREGLQRVLARVDGTRPAARRPSVPSPLTRREVDVLGHAEQGATNLEIALALNLTESTVKSYMKTAMAKLGADNRVRACRAARQRGFLG